MRRLDGRLATLLALGAAGAGWVFARGASPWATPPALSPAALEAMQSRGVVLGRPDAPVQVVFLSDYQCEACAALELAVWDSLQALSDRGLASVRVLHTPLKAHRRAPRAAALHACSVDMGAGWVVHRRLFETRFGWGHGPPPDGVFNDVASEAGLDAAALAECLGEGSDRVEAPAFLDSVSVSGVPTVAVNGRAVVPTAAALLAEIDRALRGGWDATPAGDQVSAGDQARGCRAVAPISPDLRARVEAACRVAAERIAEKLAITPAHPTFTIEESDITGDQDSAPDEMRVVVPALDSLPRLLLDGVVEHEVAHLVVFAWLDEAVGDEWMGRAQDEYGSRLPDLLDDGLAALGEPPHARENSLQALGRFDPQPLGVTLALVHPGAGRVREPVASRTVRSVQSPCRGACPRPRPNEWMVVTERWVANRQGPDTYTVDTTFSPERPPEPEVDPVTRFYTLAELLISFLEEELGEPARLRDYVLALLAPGDPVDPMAELERRLGAPRADIEARWAEWVLRTKEAVG